MERSGHFYFVLTSPDGPVMDLFDRDPTRDRAPLAVRMVRRRSFFATPEDRRQQGIFWRLGPEEPVFDTLSPLVSPPIVASP